MEENTAMMMEEEMNMDNVSDILPANDPEESVNEEFIEIDAAPLILGGVAIVGLVGTGILLLTKKGKEITHNEVIKVKAKIRMRKDARKLLREDRKKEEDKEIDDMIKKLKEAAKSKKPEEK